MIHDIEQRLPIHDWAGFRDLYHQIKSGIFYAAGIRGRFNSDVPYNIETLVNTLYELERNEDHPIYPFVAAWNSRLLAHAGDNFGRVREFRKRIVSELQTWVQPETHSRDDYYQGLQRLQRELQFPLRVFSLNYDCCVEHLSRDGFVVETGFGANHDQPWEWKRFDETEGIPIRAQIYLYKMHGSIDWKRDDAGNLVRVRYSGRNIDPTQLQVIFGRDFKLEAADPYLFYAFEFRRCTLDATVIVVIGYGFGDEHINKMLAQAFRRDPRKRLLVVDRCEEHQVVTRQAEVAKRIGAPLDAIVFSHGGARQFLSDGAITAQVLDLLPATVGDEF
jgi:hypothetical protein